MDFRQFADWNGSNRLILYCNIVLPLFEYGRYFIFLVQFFFFFVAIVTSRGYVFISLISGILDHWSNKIVCDIVNVTFFNNNTTGKGRENERAVGL